ncbi:MAG: TerC family protein [Deltaproteobacteria bacterium]|nr:TerC family protein [Deltaproteobacteria bacterium]
MIDWISNPDAWIALGTLTALEVVLGVDNIIFISILSGKLPTAQRAKARGVGLLLAMFMRILLLLSISWVMRLQTPLFSVFAKSISGKDLILILGGLFLLAKSTFEIHDKLEGEEGHASTKVQASFFGVVLQIILLDIIFSVDSVVTAVGMAESVIIMIIAVVIAVGVMMLSSTKISDFVHRHPTLKMLALSFLLLIGFSLIADGFSIHVPKGYLYFAMGFSVFVEMLNIRLRAKTRAPIKLRESYVGEK